MKYFKEIFLILIIGISSSVQANMQDITHALSKTANSSLASWARGAVYDGHAKIKKASIDLNDGSFSISIDMDGKPQVKTFLGRLTLKRTSFNSTITGKVSPLPNGKCRVDIHRIRSSNSLIKVVSGLSGIIKNVLHIPLSKDLKCG